MNKLVLIGNGFDLAHGLKTKYSDFILWYLKDVVGSLVRVKSYSDDLIHAYTQHNFDNIDLNSVADFHKFLETYKSHVNIKYNYPFIEQLIKQSGDPKWVDIESMYYHSLLKIYRVLEKANIDSHPRTDGEIKDLNDCFDAIKKKLIEYLSLVDNEDIEIKDDIKQHFKEELWTDSRDSARLHFLIFNYTSTIEKYLRIFDPNTFTVNYIHGKLNDDRNPIIFGYGDEMDTYYEKIERLNNNEFLKNIKSFDYFKTTNYQEFSNFIKST
ncbi:MAG: hypothetical protein KAJ50_03710, partial [Bacteroidales bacterium]|nr:hypothetical protein [Bacteroidales bacterium]